MNIYSLTLLKYNRLKKTYNIYEPQFKYSNTGLYTYVVQRGEDMRLDLVMLSMYNNDPYTLKDSDVILFINGIDNPLNIFEGDTLYYPAQEALESYRYVLETGTAQSKNIMQALAVPNKTTIKDKNRKKFVDNGFVLPPVVLDESKSPVRLENGNIVIGGLN
jgi:hypothetical protein